MAAGMPQQAVHSQLAAAVDAVVHLGRGVDGTRRVTEIAVLVRDGSGSVSALPAVRFGPDASTSEEPGAALLGRKLRR
jgi:pilus assembly protein CpaF